MKKNKVSSEKLGDLGILSIGTKAIYLKQNQDSSNSVIVKVIKWSDLTNLINDKEANSITEYKIDMQKFYKRASSIIEKGDLIFSALPSLSGENIILIDRDFEDTYICNDNMFIFKNKSNYSSEYLYLILKSGLYNKYLQHLKVGYNKKLTIKMLADIEIPILDEEKELVNEYSNLQKVKQEIQKQEENFNNKVYELTKCTLNM